MTELIETTEPGNATEAASPVHVFVRLWHFFLRVVSPGYSYCSHCKKPWSFAKEHSTNYTLGMACFPLCEKCWSSMSIEQRIPYYRRLWLEWGDFGNAGQQKWKDIEAAVRNGL